MHRILPIFYGHRQDHLIPEGYGIEENADGGFYPFRLRENLPVYLRDVNGKEIRKETYEQALEHLAEIVD
jgi:hypothetical protein